MTVYIVFFDEDYQNYEVKGVFQTKCKAENYIKTQISEAKWRWHLADKFRYKVEEFIVA